ncbi:hypothetical protein [Ruminococcus flavefaciens]|uniref:hypothetical protein n=1 Tax=Ruminococcus flavefaciens TaxID=1265 RepID=UPI00156779B1|nr:hypothetical protein [Ruminococcus flavefaciens]
MSGFSVRGSVAQNDGASARTIVQNWLDSNNYEALAKKQVTHYTLQDISNLQDFLLAKPTEEDLRGNPSDLDGDGVWSVFDLCLMRQKYAENSATDATSSATIISKHTVIKSLNSPLNSSVTSRTAFLPAATVNSLDELFECDTHILLAFY